MALASGNDFVEQSSEAKFPLFSCLPVRKLFCASVGGGVGMLLLVMLFYSLENC
ncbi:unnamed protein product [Onchocerca flexuosa]|uniref:Uncharacterized protein n=1 Tax=Onchocerca flexuosa TaxID=387005 RepID=A0A183H8U6_9BILA|nr:unnamed protein product [Onchocerca flexuosa]